jgi:phthalate 4,5-dioxygenase oxygenase subunit
MASPRMKDTQSLTRVGPGTTTGEFIREYWIPAALATEVVADGAPLRVRLLGEDLIAFRTGSGKIGLMDHHCPHRCASLFYGRNEGEGIRCVYHGWKFDTDGRCLDIPNVPKGSPIRDKVHATSYPVTEKAGVIWTYMGKRDVPPPFPDLPVFRVTPERVDVWCMQRECNYLQAMEGDLDTSHAGFLHLGVPTENAAPDRMNDGSAESLSIIDPAPEFKVDDTPCGVMAGARRFTGADQAYWRYTQYLLPVYAQIPPCPLGSEAILRAWVPMDDTHTMFFSITTDTFCLSKSPVATPRAIPQPGLTVPTDYDFLPNTTDWYGRWRLTANLANDHLIDRAVQKTNSYSGIEGLDVQDTAITESMGAIIDHEFEMLVPTDMLVVRMRQRLLRASRAFAADGALPPSIDDPGAYRDLWSGYVLAPREPDWRDVYAGNIPRDGQWKAA